MARLTSILLLICLGGCTLGQRNLVARTLCDRNAHCTTVGPVEVRDGPPQVRAMENPRMASATATKK